VPLVRRAPSFALAAIVLAACADAPERPEPPRAAVEPPQRAVAPDTAQTRAVAKHQRLAARAKEAGDLAGVQQQRHVLTLLDPDNAAFRRELEQARAAVARAIDSELDSGRAAARRGDTDAAIQSLVRVLALDPDNAEATKTLRDLDRHRAARVQAERAARVARNAMPQPPDSFDVEQRIELFVAGDTASGLRELKRYVDANPGDGAARGQIGTAVYERARELETQGARENALAMYEQAIALRGEAMPSWSAKVGALRKSLSIEYYEKGVRAAPTDAALAIRHFETSLKFDPGNKAAAARLAAARRTIAPTKSSGPGR
jgi:tetratricopeptide (TPR) repeat protein